MNRVGAALHGSRLGQVVGGRDGEDVHRDEAGLEELLGGIKAEFGKYADVLGKLKKKLGEAQNTIDRAETRTRAIQRKLRDVEGSENLQLAEGDQFEEEEDEDNVVAVGVAEEG